MLITMPLDKQELLTKAKELLKDEVTSITYEEHRR